MLRSNVSMAAEVYFINEDYNWFPELFSELDGVGHHLASDIHLSINKPLRYQAMEYPSSCAKSFYDAQGIFVTPKIAKAFMQLTPKGINIAPVSLTPK